MMLQLQHFTAILSAPPAPAALAVTTSGVWTLSERHSIDQDLPSYCDTYENSCKPCSVVCEGGGGLEECSAECPDYFRSVIHSHRMEAQQLHQLTVMVSQFLREIVDMVL